MTAHGDYYDQSYRSYEAQNPVRKLDHYLSVVGSATDQPSPRLLDFGCGPGSFVAHLAAKRPGWEVSGTDINPSALETVTRKTAGAVSVELYRESSRPFAGTQFDVITAWDVLEHLMAPAQQVARFRQWLKPGGHLIFVVPIFDGLSGPLVRRLDRDPTHLHKESKAYWLDLASKAFSVTSWHGIFRYLIGSSFYLHFPTRRLRSFAPAILVICRRD